MIVCSVGRNVITRAVVQEEVAGFLILLLASAIMARLEGRTIADYGLPWRSMFRRQFWQGTVVGFAMCTALLASMWAVGVFHVGNLALHTFDIWKWGAIWAVVFVLVGLREEFFARGYLVFTLSTGIGFWPAAVVSALLFSYAHQGNSGEDWLGLVQAGAFGLVACLFLRRTGGLWMSIGLHAAFDWAETYFYGVADSGIVVPGHLLSGATSGPAWLSGGTVGPEGSVIATLVLVVVWLIAARWLREVKYPATSSLRTPRGIPGMLSAGSRLVAASRP